MECRIAVSVDGFPSCEWRVRKQNTVDGILFGEVDMKRVDSCAVANPIQAWPQPCVTPCGASAAADARAVRAYVRLQPSVGGIGRG